MLDINEIDLADAVVTSLVSNGHGLRIEISRWGHDALIIETSTAITFQSCYGAPSSDLSHGTLSPLTNADKRLLQVQFGDEQVIEVHHGNWVVLRLYSNMTMQSEKPLLETVFRAGTLNITKVPAT